MENANFVKRNLLFVFISFVLMIFSCSSVKGYIKGDPINEDDYLTFTAFDNPVEITLNSGFGEYSYPAAKIQYSKLEDGSNDWTPWTDFAADSTVNVPTKGSIRLRGTNVNTANNWERPLFVFNNYVDASGYVDSLRLKYNEDTQSYGNFQGLDGFCYRYMFYGCSNLLSAPKLGCTSMTWTVVENEQSSPKEAIGCYEGMFMNCSKLQAASDLPAEELANSCYNDMYNGCTSLMNLPIIGATKLATNCYQDMFKGCTNLKLSVDGIGDASEAYTHLWTFKAFDEDANGNKFDSAMSMFDVSSFPDESELEDESGRIKEIFNKRPNLYAVVDKNGYVTLFSKYALAKDADEIYPGNSGNTSQGTVVDSQEDSINSKDVIIAYVNVSLKDSDMNFNFIVTDPISINNGIISKMELKSEDESGIISSLDSLGENTRAYITVCKKQDGSCVASSKVFNFSSENNKTTILPQTMYKSSIGEPASDNVSDADVWNDNTPAVYILSITLVDAA